MDEPKWVDDLPRKHKAPRVPTTKRYDKIVEQLKAKPGKWALISEQRAGSCAGYINTVYPGVEACCRDGKYLNGRQVFNIYARWVGVEDE